MATLSQLGTMSPSDVVKQVVDTGTAAVSKSAVRIVVVIVGLLLIAAGLFQFQKVQEITGVVGKTAAAAL
jgi:predicted metal-binding membrane protein